jgi:hypothetical protein
MKYDVNIVPGKHVVISGGSYAIAAEETLLVDSEEKFYERLNEKAKGYLPEDKFVFDDGIVVTGWTLAEKEIRKRFVKKEVQS